MAKKKAEIALQEEVNTQEEWEAVLQREGLIVVDIYQDWCGPCKAVSGLFRRLKNELNDDLLHFVVAKADTIESLDKHRGRCQPCFHFYGGGCLVAAVEGVNPPELERCIIEKLKQEHEVMKGEMERIEIRDPLVVALELEEAEMLRRMLEEEEVVQEVSILVIKPDIYAAGKGDEIIEQLAEYEIEVLDRKEFTFSEDDVGVLYEEQKAQVFFRDMLHFLTSGPSEILMCTKGNQNVIEDLRKLIGPALPFPTDEEIEPLRPKYASDFIRSAFHAPVSKEEVERALSIFYPDYEPTIIRVKRTQPLIRKSEESASQEAVGEVSPFQTTAANLPDTQRTVAILRPEAYAKYKTEILERIREAGFQIAIQKEIHMSVEQAQQYYSDQVDEPYFDKLIAEMTSGPCLVMLLSKPEAIFSWREIIGPADPEEALSTAPESLRAKFMTADSELSEGMVKKPKEGDNDTEEVKSEEMSSKISDSQKSNKEPVQDEEQKDETKASQDEKKSAVGEKEAEEGSVKKEEVSNSNADAAGTEEEAEDLAGDKKEPEEAKLDGEKEVKAETEGEAAEVPQEEGQEPKERLSKHSEEHQSVGKTSADNESAGKGSAEKESTGKGSAERESLKSKEGDEVVEEEVVVRKVRINLIHGSRDELEADRDIEFFFPIERTVAVIKPDAYANRDEIVERIKENGFAIESRKDIQLTTDVAQEMYRHLADKGFYDDLVNHMTSGRSLFLILARQDAVTCWRQLIGHTDPDKAADEAPDSIRATYGRNVIANAVYGALSPEEAEHIIELVFTEPTESIHDTGEEGEEDEEQKAESALPSDEAEKGEGAEGESEVKAEDGSAAPVEEEPGEAAAEPPAEPPAELLAEPPAEQPAEPPAEQPADESEAKPETAPADENPAPEQPEPQAVEEPAKPEPETESAPEQAEPEVSAENQNASANGSIRPSRNNSGSSSTSNSVQSSRIGKAKSPIERKKGDQNPKGKKPSLPIAPKPATKGVMKRK